MNEKIVPVLSQGKARLRATTNIEAWKNFAQRITKNPFVKAFLLQRDGNSCAWCNGHFVKQPTIHHISYEHCCSYKQSLCIAAPTPGNPHKTRIVPDCEGCNTLNRERFLSCMSRLVLIHSLCNRKIAEKTYEIRVRENPA